jgi:hypothetical protein
MRKPPWRVAISRGLGFEAARYSPQDGVQGQKRRMRLLRRLRKPLATISQKVFAADLDIYRHALRAMTSAKRASRRWRRHTEGNRQAAARQGL